MSVKGGDLRVEEVDVGGRSPDPDRVDAIEAPRERLVKRAGIFEGGPWRVSSNVVEWHEVLLLKRGAP